VTVEPPPRKATSETALIPCPACGAACHHPMVEGARKEWRDNCKGFSLDGGGCRFSTTRIAVTCAVCGHAWNMERHYSEPDTSAGINFGWYYPDGRIFHDWDRDEPAMLSYDPKDFP
jgi:hypothetical protein